MCLHGNRFSVTVNWRDFFDNAGLGVATKLSDQSGYFWLIAPPLIEFFINIYDGRAINGDFWVYFSAVPNIEFTVTVTDTQTGFSKQYVNPLGESLTELDNGFSRIPPPPPIPAMSSATRALLVVLLALIGWSVLRFKPTRRS